MANERHTFRDVFMGGSIVAVQIGPGGPDEVGLAIWDGAQRFTFWITFDGYAWERLGVEQHDTERTRWQAQEWAAHRLAHLLLHREG